MIAKGFNSDALRHELVKTPEGRLLVSVFVQAIHDLSKVPNATERRNFIRKKSHTWLMNDSYMLDICCWLLDVDIDILRENIESRKFIKSMATDIHKYYIGKKRFDVLDNGEDILSEFEGDGL